MSLLGMNASIAVGVADSVAGLSSGLASIDEQVRLARLISLNPLGYMLSPGSAILAPVSIGVAASASVDIANVRQTLDYLVLKLRQEAQQQIDVSNSLTPADPGWFASAPTAKRPEDLTLLDEFAPWVNVASWALLIEGIVSTTLDALDKWWAGVPDWVKKSAKFADNAGKLIPWVGAPVGWVSVATEWDDDYVWGNTRNIIGAVIGTAELVTLIPPLTVATPFVAAAGLVWDVFDTVWDLGDEFWW